MVVVGIDEVGRGCWAGPLVAAAVALDKTIAGLKDSKLLSKIQRDRLDVIIQSKALAVGVGWVSPLEIDEIGLSAANALAMQRAMESITITYNEIIIDGNINYLIDNPKARALIKADATVPLVSAASIIAKVARDKYMSQMAKQFPDYGFERHVGYGTALHMERLKLHGISTLHRKSFMPIKALAAA